MHPQVQKLLQIPQYEQRSPEWFEQREKYLTSSIIDTVLGNNKYAMRINRRKNGWAEILFKKCGVKKPFLGNEATKHGQEWEDPAIARYCKIYNKKTKSFGLLPHPTIPFLAGSPDDITEDGIVIEVKCPYRRKIIMGEIPLQYDSQLKMNMEICNLDHGVFIEYVPPFMNKGEEILNIVHIKRDPAWLSTILPQLQKLWDEITYWREQGIETHPLYNDVMEIINKKPKKSLNVFLPNECLFK